MQNKLQDWHPAEAAIYHAMGEVEKLPAGENQTKAITLLQEAKLLVRNGGYLNQDDRSLSPEEKFDRTGLLKGEQPTTDPFLHFLQAGRWEYVEGSGWKQGKKEAFFSTDTVRQFFYNAQSKKDNP